MRSAQCASLRLGCEARSGPGDCQTNSSGVAYFARPYVGLFPVFPAFLCTYTAANPRNDATAWNHPELLAKVGIENMRQLYTKTVPL